MSDFRDYFVCDSCDNKDFKLIYNFSLRLHKVNFSDKLIYDELTEELYQCTNCQKNFTRAEMENGLIELKKKYKDR